MTAPLPGGAEGWGHSGPCATGCQCDLAKMFQQPASTTAGGAREAFEKWMKADPDPYPDEEAGFLAGYAEGQRREREACPYETEHELADVIADLRARLEEECNSNDALRVITDAAERDLAAARKALGGAAPARSGRHSSPLPVSAARQERGGGTSWRSPTSLATEYGLVCPEPGCGHPWADHATWFQDAINGACRREQPYPVRAYYVSLPPEIVARIVDRKRP